MKLFFTFTVLCFPFLSFAQVKKFTVNGTVRDKESGETLIGANVIFSGQTGLGAVTNAYGFYSVSAAEGNYKMIVSFSGYSPDTIPVQLDRNIELSVALGKFKTQLDEVTITSRKKNLNKG